MHELPITQSILDIVVETAHANNATRVSGINLVIGELSSIVDDSVQFYFDLLSKDTIAHKAQLNFKREPASVTCLDCQHQYTTIAPLNPFCPNCNSNRIRVTGGKEFYIESIEVDE